MSHRLFTLVINPRIFFVEELGFYPRDASKLNSREPLLHFRFRPDKLEISILFGQSQSLPSQTWDLDSVRTKSESSQTELGS